MVEFEQLSFLDDEKPLFKIKNPIMLIDFLQELEVKQWHLEI